MNSAQIENQMNDIEFKYLKALWLENVPVKRDGWWTDPGAKSQDQRERGEGYGGLRPTEVPMTHVILVYEKDKLSEGCIKRAQAPYLQV